MAFFDDLGRKLSETGQSVVQRTKDMTDIARINSAITEETKTIEETFFQIGKLYYALHADNCEEDFSAMVSTIKDCEKKIDEYQQQIQTIKGIVKCPRCGSEVASTAAFCISCGAAMPTPTPTPSFTGGVRCTYCNSIVPAGMKFCTSCGRPMSTISQPSQSKMQCSGCGADLEPGMAFCTTCGTPVSASAQPVPNEQVDEPVSVQPAAEQNRCSCGAVLAEGTAFCTACGKPVAAQSDTFEDIQSVSEPVNEPVSEPVSESDSESDSEPVNTQPEPDTNRCIRCGAVLLPGSAFCTACGYPVSHVHDRYEDIHSSSAPAPDYTVKCSNCGETLEPGTAFCTACGTPVGNGGQTQQPDYKVCPRCGSTVDGNALFCTSCGNRF